MEPTSVFKSRVHSHLSGFLHKFHGLGLRCEIGIAFGSGHIVWVHGPFPAGSHTDQVIFNSKLRNKLLKKENVLADNGYSGKKVIHDSILGDPENDLACRSRVYHECINGRFKMFNCLQNRFRHSIEKHNLCVFAIANIVQLELENNIPRNQI